MAIFRTELNYFRTEKIMKLFRNAFYTAVVLSLCMINIMANDGKNSLQAKVLVSSSNTVILFTAEKDGINAYKIGDSPVLESTWNADADIISFSGTKNGIGIALKSTGNEKHYQYKSIKKDFFILSRIIVPQDAKTQNVVFSYDANYAAVMSPYQQGSKITVYRKNESIPCINQITDETISGAVFSQDSKTIIIWQQKLQEKTYSITAYNIKSGKIILKTTLDVPMGYSGLWPLNVRCISANQGVFVSNVGNDMQYQYREIDSAGSVNNISREYFFEELGEFFVSNKGVFKFLNHGIVTVINYNDYLDDAVVIKSAVSPDKRFVALATTKGYYVIDLTTRKLISIAPKIFNDVFCWGEYFEPDELSNALREWKIDCYKPGKNKFLSRINFHTEKFHNIMSKGPIISAPLMLELQKGNEEVVVFFPKLLKLVFESSFDSKEKKWLFNDYPDYVYYPPGLHANKKDNKIDTIWIYWWNEGRKLTSEIFKRKHEAYIAVKKSGKEDAAKKAYITLQNMGIIILPNLLEKIESGESDLIPMFNHLSNQKDLRNTADCRKWWENNEEKYRDILNY